MSAAPDELKKRFSEIAIEQGQDVNIMRWVNDSTMLSTERTVSELKQIDEATGGRIYEMTKGYCLEIGGGKNWRFIEH